MAANIAPLPKMQFSQGGVPLSGGKLFTYSAGTTTKLSTFTNSGGGTPNTNPIILDSQGQADVWLSPGSLYKFVLSPSTDTDPPTNAFWTVDNIQDAYSFAISTSGQTVENITALRALSKSLVTKAIVLGYTSRGDGGGGQYYYDSIDTTSADNGGTVIVASDGGRWKLVNQGFVTFKQFGAKGDNIADDTAAIQACLNAALVSGAYKRIYAGQGNFKVTSTITIPSYYNAALSSSLWGSVGQDFQIDFGHATITSTVAAGGTVFTIPATPYPNSRYFLDITGGTFYSTTAIADVFRITGGSLWMCRFNGNSVPAATAPGAFVRLYNTDATYEPGALSIRDAVVSADSVFTFDNAAAGLLFADNFTFDNIYHFGTLATSGTIRLLGSTGLISPRISKVFQVGVGGIVYAPAAGYVTYGTLSDLYSESTTNNVNLIFCLLQSCTLQECRGYVVNSTTQNMTWYTGQSNGSVFNNLHVNAGNLSGAMPYDTAAYAYYPVLVFNGTSKDNTVLGYSTNQYKNAVQGRTGGIANAIGVSDRACLTSFDYTGSSISAAGFTQCGSTIPQVQYLGQKFYLDVSLRGIAYGAGAKTLGVEFRVGTQVLELGGDISITAGQWKAEARFVFNFVSGTTYNVIMSFGESWSGSTVATNKLGTVDLATVSVNSTDAISFGLNVKAISGAGVAIGDGAINCYRRFALYDSLT